MKLIVGLGNPGAKYQKTRHNLGFLVIDYLAQNEEWKKSKKTNCLYLKKQINSEAVELIKPQTFMNNSGRAVNYAQKKHYIKPEDIIVIHDDIDLPLGEIKIQKGRGSAGHHGVQSVIDQLGTKDFTRMRIGIKPINNTEGRITNAEKFVLENFTAEEKDLIKQIIEKAVQMITTAIKT